MERTHATGISFFGSGSAFGGLINLVSIWQDRARERRHLSQLEPHILKDIGIEPSALHREIGKPFWRA